MQMVELFAQPKKERMNKQDLAAKVHDMLGGTKTQADQVVETIIETITKALKSGDEVSVAGLGIFSTKMRPARTGRNPRTGESIQVPAMRVPKFRPAKALKDAVK
jgi:DNA-binding protein HU-beta